MNYKIIGKTVNLSWGQNSGTMRLVKLVILFPLVGGNNRFKKYGGAIEN